MSPHVVDRLSAYLDHELSVAEATLVREHLAGCEACGERLAHLAAVDLGVRDLKVVAPAGYFDSFASRVRERVLAASRPKARFRVPTWSWAVAAALLLAVIVPRLPKGSDGPPPLPAQEARASDPTALSSGQTRADAGAAAPAAAAERLRELADAAPSADAKTRAKSELAGGGAPAPSEEAQGRFAAAPPFASAPPLATPTPAAPAAALPAGPTRTAQALPAPAAKTAGLAEGKTDAALDEPLAASDAASRDEVRAQVAAAERSDLEKDKGADERAPGAKPQAAAAGAGREGEALKLRRANVGERAAPAPLTPTAAEYGALEAQRSPQVSVAQQREGWRAFAARHPEDSRADEARVRVVALGVDLARQTGDEADRVQALEDGAGYLARKDAAQKGRVRALLESLTR